ncbi:MAG: nucleotide sugar dehydrogenase [Bdellovibrionota bacterium]
MDISIFGLGYVGCVGIGCLSHQGHKIIGVDVNLLKINQINRGLATIVEKNIDNLIKVGYEKGLISATSDSTEAVLKSDVSFICVGTPNDNNGHLNLSGIYGVAKQIGAALRSKKSFHTIAIRSTVRPGTNNEVAKIIAAESGKRNGEDFAVVSNPELLREGSAVEDYLNPCLTVVGTESKKAQEIFSKLYSPLGGKIEFVQPGVAEIIKYVNNSYHALKITFANEVGNVCKSLLLDSHEVMRLFCADTRLNISSKYFLPGFAYGGSCLPKDLGGLNAMSHDAYLKSPVLENIEVSNKFHMENALKLIVDQGKSEIAILGLSFKVGTDDLRNSPAVELAERLIGKGHIVRIYDKYVHLSKLTGKNKEEIERRLPHLSELISDDLEKVVSDSKVIVFSYREDCFLHTLKQFPDKTYIDLVRIHPDLRSKDNYIGLSW